MDTSFDQGTSVDRGYIDTNREDELGPDPSIDSSVDPETSVDQDTCSGGSTPEIPKDCGDMSLRLGYLPDSEKLTVVLLKARNLKCFDKADEEKQLDPYICVSILHDGHLLKKKKTSTKRKTSNPTYNQAINFAVPLDVFPQVAIQFHIVNDTGVQSQSVKTIGYLEIGPHSSGDEYDHWVDLMSNKPQARWHKLKGES